MRAMILLSVTVMMAACGGCGLHAMTLPNSFVAVDKAYLAPYEVRGLSADAVVVGLRREANPDHGTLEFWTPAIRTQLTVGCGYKPAGEESVKSDGGTPGSLMTFSTEQQGETYTYIIAIFVQGGDVLVAEAGGKADAVAPRTKEIRAALLSVR
jgi:hypothetical protein